MELGFVERDFYVADGEGVSCFLFVGEVGDGATSSESGDAEDGGGGQNDLFVRFFHFNNSFDYYDFLTK